MKLKAALTVLALAALACGQYVTPTPAAVEPTLPPSTPTAPATAAPEPTVTASATEAGQTAVIRATVYVRQMPDAASSEVGSLTTGDRVEVVKCSGDWCEIRTDELTGFVFRGCTDNNPDGLKCEVRP